MIYVSAIIERGKIADKAEASDRAPAHVFDQAVVDFSVGRDHHGASGELAVVESEEQTSTCVSVGFSLHAQRKCRSPKVCKPEEHGQKVAGRPPSRKSARA